MKISHNITKSVEIDTLKFSTRADYEQYFLDNGVVTSVEDIWRNKKYVQAVHRHWHGEGRTGCVFALLAAKKSEAVKWVQVSIVDTLENIDFLEIENIIKEAITNPEEEILSLLFSQIISTADLVLLFKKLLSLSIVIKEDESHFSEVITLALRIPVTSNGVLSWLMAFGEFPFFPKTRQSPIMEIAIRLKEKPQQIFHRLTPDREAAHLADLPLDLDDIIKDKVWETTIKRTRLILGEEPNFFSAAKTTVTLPKNEWLLRAI